MFISCREHTSKKFKLIDSEKTGIKFNNKIEENGTINVLEYMNIYTGAGVAVGDVNNDGLTDVYFSGNMVSGRLYLNQGDFKFKDITQNSGLLNESWGTGATMIDINQDGFLDIYVCVSGPGSDSKLANLLYINNGPSASGEITFTESAKHYGLADTRQSMQAAFFDYDNDDDLDMYLLVNPAAYEHQVNTSFPRKLNGESINNDRLYRNDGDINKSGHPVFTDVSNQAGILVEGYGLGVGISDINNDNWPDIYVSNDFIGNDILYINQKDGTFKDELSDYIQHTSYAGMGNDIADIDNNGKPDIVVLDMRPEDNKRQKLIISSTGYDRFQMMLKAGYDPQYSRNTLQLNQGEGKFSEIGNMAGISSTDWSWSPLLADFDNDGLKDLYVTNGFLRDLGDLDYINYQGIYDNPLGDKQAKIDLKLNSIKELPAAKLSNYAYKNNGNTTFEKVSNSWGIDIESCSNGAAFADLDNDGDLDLLVNNVNQEAFVYQNTSESEKSNHFLRLKLVGDNGNKQGIGAKITLSSASGNQYYQHFLSRGYESSIDPIAHFGLGKDTIVDNLTVQWPDSSIEILKNVSTNQLIKLNKKNAKKRAEQPLNATTKKWFTEVTSELNVEYNHQEDGFVDFKSQPILPHMNSRNGPGVSVADINGDGLEDFYVGGANGYKGSLFLQKSNGTFTKKDWMMNIENEDLGSLFFDADNDGDLDLYIVSGGAQQLKDENLFQDRLYVNDGLGNFSEYAALPLINSSGSVVTASDFDKDGDLDLFVGGRVTPESYPLPSESFLLENKTKVSDRPIFKNISYSVTDWNKLTMVTSALWTDYDNDSWMDLIVVGEFMPITIFHNDNGVLNYISNPIGLEKSEGWWNSIASGDFDLDGDMDYIVGNMGLNTKFKVSEDKPLSIHAKDYEKDGRLDPLLSFYNGDHNYLANSRDEIISQINVMKSRFRSYKSYAEVTFEQALLPSELEDAYVVKAYNFNSSIIENLGNGSFKLTPLPIEAQMAPVEGIVVQDFDQDGLEDIVLTGNSYQTDVSTGRYDAIIGVVLKSNGTGTFTPLSLSQSGFVNDYDGSGLALLKDVIGNVNIIAANNNGPLKMFKSNHLGGHSISLSKEDQSAEILLNNGKTYKKEFYYGSGYLSQSSRSLIVSKQIKQVRIKDAFGNSKIVFEAQ